MEGPVAQLGNQPGFISSTAFYLLIISKSVSFNSGCLINGLHSYLVMEILTGYLIGASL